MLGSDRARQFPEEEADRPTGIFTKAQRRYLLGLEEDASDRAEQQRMVRIRRRVRNALIDGELLSHLESEDIDLIFNPTEQSEEEKSRVLEGTLFLLSFLYRGLKQSDKDVEYLFEETVKETEYEFPKKRGKFLDPERIEVNFTVERPRPVDINTAVDKYRNGERLTNREIGALLRSGELSIEELSALSDAHDRG